MIKKILDNKSIEFLTSTIGTKINSIEIGDGEKEFNRSYGKLRINFNKGNIEIYNIETMVDFMGEKDDMSGFYCEINVEESFVPFIDEGVDKIFIDKDIERIAIIQDIISVNDEIAIFDEAIIFEGEEELMISRDWQYSESINFYHHSNYNLINPINKVVEYWNNFGEFDTSVERIIKYL